MSLWGSSRKIAGQENSGREAVPSEGMKTAAPFRMGKEMKTTRVVQLLEAWAFAGS
jgi:hypothetical protein